MSPFALLAKNETGSLLIKTLVAGEILLNPARLEKSKAKQGEIDRQTISLSSHSPMDRLQTLARRKKQTSAENRWLFCQHWLQILPG